MNPRQIRALRIAATLAICFVSAASIAMLGSSAIVPTLLLAIGALMLAFGRIKAFFVALGIFVVAGLIIPAIDPAAEARRRMTCHANLESLASAIRQFESENGYLPPPYTSDVNGSPLHSWRVLILPFLGEQSLFDRIDITKPWDDPVNLPFADLMPDIYRCPEFRMRSKWGTTTNTTAYVAVIDPQSIWTLGELRTVAECEPLAIAIVESETHRLPWMSPHDPTRGEYIDALNARSDLGPAHAHGNGFHITQLDGCSSFYLPNGLLEWINTEGPDEVFSYRRN